MALHSTLTLTPTFSWSPQHKHYSRETAKYTVCSQVSYTQVLSSHPNVVSKSSSTRSRPITSKDFSVLGRHNSKPFSITDHTTNRVIFSFHNAIHIQARAESTPPDNEFRPEKSRRPLLGALAADIVGLSVCTLGGIFTKLISVRQFEALKEHLSRII